MASANNIQSHEEASHPHVGEDSGRGRSFRRRHIGTAGEALQPSTVPLTRSSQDRWWDADEETTKEPPILDLGAVKPVAVLSIRSDSCVGPSTIQHSFASARKRKTNIT